jgi:hypothetical protein
MLTPITPARARHVPQALDRISLSAIVETHAIDDGMVFREPEQARLRISALRQGGQGAEFGKTTSKMVH